MVDAMYAAKEKLEGAYAIAAIDIKDSTNLVIARNKSPLLIGIGTDEMFAASDPLAIAQQTNDFIFLEDVQKLFDLADDKYAVMCAHHDHTPKPGTKMDGQQQTLYPRKNWSSMVLWNCGHEKNKAVTTELVNDPDTTGKYLHRFAWLDDSEVGQVSHEWNWLVDWYNEPEDGTPKAIHYTEGGPWFENYRYCTYHQLWKNELHNMMHGAE